MTVMNVFKTSTTVGAPLDGSQGEGTSKPGVSDFLTVQSFSNFAAMTGAITAAWHALQKFQGLDAGSIWVPYSLAIVWGGISFLISLPGLKTNGKYQAGTLLGALFVAFINSLVLAGAVVGTAAATQ